MTPEDQPVTQAQLTTAQNHLIQAIAQMIGESEKRMEAFYRQETERTETKMLAAFHKFAERHDARWTAARILATDAQSRVEDLRDETLAWRTHVDQLHEEVREKLADLERRQPPQKP